VEVLNENALACRGARHRLHPVGASAGGRLGDRYLAYHTRDRTDRWSVATGEMPGRSWAPCRSRSARRLQLASNEGSRTVAAVFPLPYWRLARRGTPRSCTMATILQRCEGLASTHKLSPRLKYTSLSPRRCRGAATGLVLALTPRAHAQNLCPVAHQRTASGRQFRKHHSHRQPVSARKAIPPPPLLA
jgi:hypothetical protein